MKIKPEDLDPCSKCGLVHVRQTSSARVYVESCIAHKADGSPCRQYRTRGLTVCPLHGGSTKAAANLKAQMDRLRVREAEKDAVAVLAHEGLEPTKDPMEMLALLLTEAKAMTEKLARRVNALDSPTYFTKKEEEFPRAEVVLYERSLERTAKFAEILTKLGYEERRIRIDEELRDQVLSVIFAVVNGLGLTGEQRSAALGHATDRIRRLTNHQVSTGPPMIDDWERSQYVDAEVVREESA